MNLKIVCKTVYWISRIHSLMDTYNHPTGEITGGPLRLAYIISPAESGTLYATG